MQKLTDAATTNPIWRFVWQGLSFSLGYRIFGALIGANGFRATYVNRYVRPRAGDKILDIGCGPGHILGYFPSVNYIGQQVFFNIKPHIVNGQLRIPYTHFVMECEMSRTAQLNRAA